MAKNKVSEWSSVPANNTDIGNIDIAEGCAPSGINNAIRELMAQVKDMITGADGDSQVIGGNLSVTGTSTLTGAVTAPAGITANVTGNLTGNVTGNTSGTAASITGVNPVANGGTGLSTLTAKNLLVGNGTSAPTFIAPSTSGNVLTSNGTDWISQALPAIVGTLGASGYTKFSNGLTIAWGSMATSNSGGSNNNFYTISGSATLPVTFTNVYQAIVGFGSTGVFYGAAIGVNSLTTTSLSVAGASPYGGGNPTVNYLVIGNI